MTGTIYVSRAGDKLAGALGTLGINFKDKVVLDVGASTGGFSQVALEYGASKVYAVEKGTKQLSPSLQGRADLSSYEKTDIKDLSKLDEPADVVLIDVSFISVRGILPHVTKHMSQAGQIVVLLKPQFEAKTYYPEALNKGLIKNNTWRRKIYSEFEDWVKDKYLIQSKVDSMIPGSRGNLERFYLLILRG